MTAHQATTILAQRLGIPYDAAWILRRAQLTLHRWAEMECGDGNAYVSWAIERDEQTNKPFRVTHHGPMGGNKVYREAVADREAGALRRVAKVCAEYGLHFYHQTDPRGCALYVAREPLTDQTYSSAGVAVIA